MFLFFPLAFRFRVVCMLYHLAAVISGLLMAKTGQRTLFPLGLAPMTFTVQVSSAGGNAAVTSPDLLVCIPERSLSTSGPIERRAKPKFQT